MTSTGRMRAVLVCALLGPGVYDVKASLQGFRTAIRDNINVVVNESARADVQLQERSRRRTMAGSCSSGSSTPSECIDVIS
jgi:hypothetical protein